MSKKKQESSSNPIIIKAINIETNKVICEGVDGEEVIKIAKESGENYILDFESEPRYNFLF